MNNEELNDKTRHYRLAALRKLQDLQNDLAALEADLTAEKWQGMGVDWLMEGHTTHKMGDVAALVGQWKGMVYARAILESYEALEQRDRAAGA